MRGKSPPDRMKALITSSLLCYLGLVQAAHVAADPSAGPGVWPVPKSIVTSGAPVALDPSFAIWIDPRSRAGSSARLQRAVERYTGIILRSPLPSPGSSRESTPDLVHAGPTVTGLRLHVEAEDETLGPATNYSYSLLYSDQASNGTASASAHSIYGAMYAMESFAQLVVQASSPSLANSVSVRGSIRALAYSHVAIDDAAQFAWRGLMVDPGRRFFPMPLLHNLLDTMAAVKMNVLHLHASDYCRWSVESKLYPNLTASLARGANPGTPGFYSQEEVAALIRYAGDRGVRVVPEFDLPGHARGMLPLETQGLAFCEPEQPWRNQVRNDPAGRSLAVLRRLLAEMAALFPDPVLNLGADETSATADCPAASTRRLEAALVHYVQHDLNKQTMGWTPVEAVGELGRTIVDGYEGPGSALEAAKRGFPAVDSDSSAWYLTHPAGWDQNPKGCGYGCAGPEGYAMFWHRPGGGVSGGAGPSQDGQLGALAAASQRRMLQLKLAHRAPLTRMQASQTHGDLPGGSPRGGESERGGVGILGGEVSMWSDDYVFPLECGAWTNRFPPSKLANASCLYTRELDQAFAQSIGGITWPRGLVAAGAFWGYDHHPSLDPHSRQFAATIDALSWRLRARGSMLCKPGCGCDYLSECGVRYPHVPSNQTNGCLGGYPAYRPGLSDGRSEDGGGLAHAKEQ